MGSVSVRVVPRSSRNQIAGWDAEGRLKVKLTASPVEGAANRALVKLLAKVLGVPPSAVSISRGASSRNKQVEVKGRSDAELVRSLAPEND